MTGSLAAILEAVAGGHLPVADGLVTVVPAPGVGAAGAIVAFTGNHVVAADVPAAWVEARCPRWAFEAPFGPGFVGELGARLDARIGTLDLVLIADGTEPSDLALDMVPPHEAAALLADAPNPRTDVTVRRTPDGRGQLTVGRGLEGRWEIAIEVAPEARGRGLGRQLLLAARGVVGPGEPLYAQVAPGNIASVRTALAAGFRPFAAEILFWPGESGRK